MQFRAESHAVIGAAIEVHKTLGCGFLEAVYQDALGIQFQINKIPFEKEKHLSITYKDRVLDKFYVADFLCYDRIIVECKAVKTLTPEHLSQVLNYLHATGFKLGLLINFGSMKIEIKRVVL